jgi:hypothetical protein
VRVIPRLATLPLRRRALGALIVMLGTGLVAAGFFLDAESDSADRLLCLFPCSPFDVSGRSPAGILRHAFDHGLAPPGRRDAVGDASLRAAVIIMAASALIALVLTVLPLLRGFIGTAAGMGLLGAALLAGTVSGQSSRQSAVLHVSFGSAIVVCGAGFAVILIGGGLRAMRPLAGLASGLALAAAGGGLGTAIALYLGAHLP